MFTYDKKTVKKLIYGIIDSKLILNENSIDIVNIYSLHYNTNNDYLKSSVSIHKSFKFSLVIDIMFTKVNQDEQYLKLLIINLLEIKNSIYYIHKVKQSRI